MPPKKQLKRPKKSKEAPEKLAMDCTPEELTEHVQAAVKEHFRKKTPEKKEKEINPGDLNFFIGMTEANKRKFIPDAPLSDYDRQIKKSYETKKSGSSGCDVPQLGAQKKQTIDPLFVGPPEQQGLLNFLKSCKLTTDDITGSIDQVQQSQDFQIAPMVRTWPFKLGISLVPPKNRGCPSNANAKAA